MKSIQSSIPEAHVIRGQDQMSLFSEEELASMVPANKQPKGYIPRHPLKKLYALVEAPNGHTWWQELERVKGLTPWQICMKYKKEVLGPGYWICTYELRDN